MDKYLCIKHNDRDSASSRDSESDNDNDNDHDNGNDNVNDNSSVPSNLFWSSSHWSKYWASLSLWRWSMMWFMCSDESSIQNRSFITSSDMSHRHSISSLIPWQTTGPLSEDILLVSYPPDILLIPYPMTYSWSLMVWHITGFLSPDILLVPYHMSSNNFDILLQHW